jgi:hypothetical protein
MSKLDQEEKEILEAFERGELKSVPNKEAELKRHREYAAATQGGPVEQQAPIGEMPLSEESHTRPSQSHKSVGRDALRAYLQRSEVRLSTMHRIGGAFISGAGLLVLLPLFLKDAIAALIGIFFRPTPELIELLKLPAPVFAIPALIALMIPLYALYLLLRELILFYFSANIPEPRRSDGKRIFHPRFALTGIPFADDEGGEVKKELRKLQFEGPLRYFLLPHDMREKDWLDNLLKDKQTSTVALPEDSPSLSNVKKEGDFDEMRMAFGLAGAYDRPLVKEVAKSELSLIRHNLVLRRLVMRYMKALLLFIWTAIVLFFILPWVENMPRSQALADLTGGFLVWSGSVLSHM